ncbi:MAG: hypothetical protein RL094_188 [Candidatus Parcubacteria bacterium]|jgi:large subunit ribosomal protein L4
MAKTTKTSATKAVKEPKAKKAAKTVSLEAQVVTQEGKSAGTVNLPESVFGLPWNADLVHQVVTSMRTDAREPIAHTKTRGEVRGGGKKPWKQKGTGRARHGSTRSPIWVGGGVAHGPRNDKNFDRKVNKKMKAKALFTILSRKHRDGEVLFVKTLSLEAPKAKEAREVFTKLGSVKGFELMGARRNNAALIAVASLDQNVKRGFSNFGNLEVSEIRNINPLSVLKYKYLVISSPEEAFTSLTAKMEKSN